MSCGFGQFDFCSCCSIGSFVSSSPLNGHEDHGRDHEPWGLLKTDGALYSGFLPSLMRILCGRGSWSFLKSRMLMRLKIGTFVVFGFAPVSVVLAEKYRNRHENLSSSLWGMKLIWIYLWILSKRNLSRKSIESVFAHEPPRF